MVEDTLAFATEEAPEDQAASDHQIKMENYIGDPSLTAVVLEYREKDCVVPWNINRRIQRVMHFQIPLRSFEATVRLPPEGAPRYVTPAISTGGKATRDESTSTTYLSSTSPRSIPVSPLARKRVQLAFANFSDDILYQARDRLRQERAATLTGERDLRIPRFNMQDSNEEIYLSCGRHCATKVGTGMYRSVRGSVPVQKDRYVYFEMSLQESSSSLRPMDAKLEGIEKSAKGESDVSVCIGLSTRMMPLNTLVGTSRYSVGFYSAGHILVGSQRRNFVSVDFRYGVNNTVGVLVRVDEQSGSSSAMKANVRFSVDGVAVRDSSDRVLVFSIPFPSEAELFPTLTLHSQGVQVLGRFSVPDVIALNPKEFQLPSEPVEIWCLDGLKLDVA